MHADDLAAACTLALDNQASFEKAYNLSGAETLSYRNMVQLIFGLMGRKTRIYKLNRSLLNGLIRMVSILPGFRHASPAMLDRMEQDLCFDHSDAVNDLNYTPRAFLRTGYNRGDYQQSPITTEREVMHDRFTGKRVLVTGAGGFIGYSMCRHLANLGCEVDAVLRDPRQLIGLAGRVRPVVIDDICNVEDWDERLQGIEAIVHLAGYVHERAGSLSEEARIHCQRLNVDSTTALARAAARTGVNRFIYASSIKVHGESSEIDHPVNETFALNPTDSYSRSKMQAEQNLHEIAGQSNLEVVVFRPPLVYGPGVKANFLRLMRLVEIGVPMPLAAIHNQRSLLYIENLVDVFARSIVHPAAAGQTFLVSDGEDVSTPMLINMLASHFNVTPRLFHVSLSMMRALAAMGGEQASVDRLVQSLVVDSQRVRDVLDWQPPFDIGTGLRETAYWYQQLYDPVRSGQSQLAAYAGTWQ